MLARMLSTVNIVSSAYVYFLSNESITPYASLVSIPIRCSSLIISSSVIGFKVIIIINFKIVLRSVFA